MAQRLRSSGRSIFQAMRLKQLGAGAAHVRDGTPSLRVLGLANLKRKASNSLSAIQDTYHSTKEVFENHRVVFTIGTSIASILTAWAGYSLRQYHHLNVERRLESIENAMKKNSNSNQEEIKRIVSSGNVSNTACIATAGTSLVIGYGLGWRGGRWFANRKLRREQLKQLGQAKPRGWQMLRRPFVRFKRNQSLLHKSIEIPSHAPNS
ncbi:hypothetical protein HPP92_000210 [Vanilla planifolia]|uniref:Uncharacterized protein n=1 Tax=Vanilla planifolia TaxID=51239 RepID=A0A835VCD8_VANPL|nr:hypothetical protein HPP92_000210 [Vanilla planifolia]